MRNLGLGPVATMALKAMMAMTVTTAAACSAEEGTGGTIASETQADGPDHDTAPAPIPASNAVTAGTASSADRALSGFFDNFLKGDLDGRVRAEDALAAAKTESPSDPRLSLALGMSNVWGSAENDRTDRTSPRLTQQQMIANAGRTISNLQMLTKLAPDEPRAWVHLGTANVTIGLASGSAAMVEKGRKMVEDHALAEQPAEVGFALGAAFAQAPAGTPEFQRAVDYYFMAFESCLGRAVDRDAPDFDGFDAQRTTEVPKDVCFNGEHWPHAEEGNFIVFGDILAKDGKPGAAERAYAAATKVPEYGSWKYRAVLESRLAGEPRPEAAIGAAPANCGQCHKR